MNKFPLLQFLWTGEYGLLIPFFPNLQESHLFIQSIIRITRCKCVCLDTSSSYHYMCRLIHKREHMRSSCSSTLCQGGNPSQNIHQTYHIGETSSYWYSDCYTAFLQQHPVHCSYSCNHRSFCEHRPGIPDSNVFPFCIAPQSMFRAYHIEWTYDYGSAQSRVAFLLLCRGCCHKFCYNSWGSFHHWHQCPWHVPWRGTQQGR